MGSPGPADPAHPARGDQADYDRYLAGMDASMRQKVALTAAHLLGEGTVADMGMGSGSGSAALAALYPRLQVIGVDVDPTMVAMAAERYRRPNLRFVVGDIATRIFPPDSLEAIFDSSVLHHVTTFTGYRHEAAREALAAQVAQLAERGVLIVRDFVDPGGGEVWLDVPSDDGEASDDPRTASTAALLERFAREFRPLSPAPGFPLERLDGARPGWQRYRLSATHAAEFVLRKDYRRDWEAEVLEEYTYMEQGEFEACYAALGLRVLASTPIRNPWIVAHRFEGRFELRSTDGEPVDPPPTNFLIAGEKVAPGQGVRFREAARIAPTGFLRSEHHRDRRTGQVYDLVVRPNPTLDVVPWFRHEGEVYVLARRSYPRPILQSSARAVALDGASPVGYVTEPLNVIQGDRPIGTTVTRALEERAGVTGAAILAMSPGTTYLPSPGAIEEQVTSVFVEIEPTFATRSLADISGFASSGYVRAIEARQLLRAAQVGGLPDARLELNVHDLLDRLGVGPGPWIGDEITGDGDGGWSPVPGWPVRSPRRVFAPAAPEESSGFLELCAVDIEEHDAAGRVIARGVRELAVPRTRSATTVSVAPLRRAGSAWYLGVDDHDLPAAQSFTGRSDLWVVPAWRLPVEATGSLRAARAWIRARLADEHGLEVGPLRELGGRYHPSPGVTPELVHPWAAVVLGEGTGARPLRWLPLGDHRAHMGDLADGHLRIAVARAAHALGLWRA